MESIKILKISLVFFAFMFLMKNLNDMKKNKTKTVQVKEKFTATPLKPGEAGFKYGGKNDKEFTFIGKKLVGSSTDYTQYDSSKWTNYETPTNNFCTSAMANEAYIYLDERWAYNNLPYNTENTLSGNTPSNGLQIETVDKLNPGQTKKGRIVIQSDYIPILLPIVDYKVPGDTASGLELKEPQTILLSYKDKKITTKDTNPQCVYKGEESQNYDAIDRMACNKHEGYCSFMANKDYPPDN
jgi:hypothetical protein